MAIKFLSGQTISGTLTVSGNVQGATFNGLAINTTGVNNLANQIVRTEANGYVNFGWINSVSGNHTGSITRITASNDAYLRYVTPAQFRTGVTDGFYAPASTVSGVTSVATGNGLTGGTITSTGTLTMASSYTGGFTFNTSVASPIHSGTVSTSGDGQNNYPFRLGSDYSAYMVAAASNTWGLFWAGNSGARYGTNGNGGPGNIWSNSTNPNEFCFVGGDSTRWSVQGSTGDTWQLGNIYLSGTFVRANNNLTLQVDGGGTPVNAITIDNVGSTTFSGYTYFPNYLFHAGDTNTRIQFSTSTITLRGDSSILLDGPVTANSRIIIQPRNDNTNVGCINSTNNQSDWQNLVASSGQFTVTQYNAIGSYSNTPTGVYTYGSVLSTRTANHSFQLYSAHTGDLAYKTQWNNDNYSGWLTPVVYGFNGGNASPNAYVYASLFIDKDNTAYYVNPASGSNLYTPITFQTNDSTLTFQDAGTNAFQMKMSAGDELYLGSNNNYQLQMTTSGNVNTQGQWRFGANFVKVGNSSTYNSDDGSWGSRFVVASTVHARIDCAQDANAVRASWYTHTGQLYSSFGTVTGHDMRLMAHNTTRQWLYSAYSEETASYRAPVFYDSNNTAFYGDFANTSTSLATAGKWVCQGGHSSARMQLNYQHSPTDSANSGTLTGWVSEPGITYNGAGIGGNINVSGQYYGRQYNSGYGCYVRFDKGNGNVEHWTTTATAGNAGGQGTRRWYNDNAGNAFASLSSRSPTFYDLNDTSYYLNANNTSQLNVLNCAGTLTVTGSGGVVASKFTDYNNGAFYLDPASTGTSLNVAGDVVAYASSDIRFKNNVTPITNALDKINKIGGYTFEWNEKSHKETGKKDIGVIAQEVEEILPEIVDTRDNGYKAVDYSKLTALLIQSVKEQQVIIYNLKSRIETLENN